MNDYHQRRVEGREEGGGEGGLARSGAELVVPSSPPPPSPCRSKEKQISLTDADGWTDGRTDGRSARQSDDWVNKGHAGIWSLSILNGKLRESFGLRFIASVSLKLKLKSPCLPERRAARRNEHLPLPPILSPSLFCFGLGPCDRTSEHPRRHRVPKWSPEISPSGSNAAAVEHHCWDYC